MDGIRRRPELNSSSQTIVITGCASGIGRALAEEFHRRGHVVYATDRQWVPLKSLADRGMRTLELDVTDPEDIQGLVRRLDADGATPDLLINNAGFGAMGPLVELPMDTLHRQFEVNVFAVVALIQAIAPRMMERRAGRIVNISSVSGVLATPFAGAYCSSKAAVNAISDSLRVELAPFGVQLLTVQPGGIRSSFGDTASLGAKLLPGSRYQALAHAIAARAQSGQENATPAEEFARRMVDKVLEQSPKPVIRIGEKSLQVPLMKKWLPSVVLDRLLMRRFQLHTLAH